MCQGNFLVNAFEPANLILRFFCGLLNACEEHVVTIKNIQYDIPEYKLLSYLSFELDLGNNHCLLMGPLCILLSQFEDTNADQFLSFSIEEWNNTGCKLNPKHLYTYSFHPNFENVALWYLCWWSNVSCETFNFYKIILYSKYPPATPFMFRLSIFFMLYVLRSCSRKPRKSMLIYDARPIHFTVYRRDPKWYY